jgi:phosphoglucomutase
LCKTFRNRTKIKFYVSVKDAISSEADFKDKLKSLEAKIQAVKTDLNLD